MKKTNVIKEMQEKCAEKIAEKKIELGFEGHFDSFESEIGIAPRSIFVTDLYGVSAWVSYGDSCGYNKMLSIEQAKKIIEVLKPSKMFMYKDGCVSFRTTRKEFKGTITELCPYLVKIGNCTHPYAEIEFFHQLPSKKYVLVKIYTEQHFFGSVTAQYNRHRDMPKYTDNRLTKSVDYQTWNSIGWWTSGDWKKDYTLYNENIDSKLF